MPEPDRRLFARRVSGRHTVRLPDGRAAGVRRWPGDGPPLVLLHGLMDSADGWETLCSRLDRECVAVDLPGFGESDLAPEPTLAAFAEHVHGALRALGIARFDLAGHSLGGAVAAVLAERAPEAVESLLLLAPAGFGRIRLAELVSTPGVRRVVEATLPLALANPLAVTAAYMTMVTNGARPAPEVIGRVVSGARRLVPGAREATQAVVSAGRCDAGLHRRAGRFAGPVTALWGDRDRIVPPSHAEGVRTAFPHAELVSWPGAGHHLQRERLEALVDVVARACPGMRAADLRAAA